MASSKLSSSVLPFELVEEILYRTPVKSLVHFKSVCKQWYALLNDKRFIYKHLNFSQKHFIQLTDHDSVQIFNPLNQALLRKQVPSDTYNYMLVQCDGLLLLWFHIFDDIAIQLGVWNPFLSQVRWIEPSSSFCVSDTYGFGYDNVSRDNYKILRFSETYTQDVEIYEFKSKLWRSIEATPTHHDWQTLRLGTSMNGNMYWVSQRNKANSETETFIQSFDFSTERFKPICCVPSKTDYLGAGYKLILAGFGGDRLSLLNEHEHVKFEVWVTNKVTDGVVSWSKYFNLARPDDLPILFSYNCRYPKYFIQKTNNIMLLCEEVDAMKENIYLNFYEIGKGEIKNQVEIGRRKWMTKSIITQCMECIASLVPVPE